MATAASKVVPIRSAIDELGAIKAQIADLKRIEDQLVEQIKNFGEGAYDGTEFRATVSVVAERSSLDIKAAELKLRDLGVDGRWFSKNQKVTKGYTTVKVVARKS